MRTQLSGILWDIIIIKQSNIIFSGLLAVSVDSLFRYYKFIRVSIAYYLQEEWCGQKIFTKLSRAQKEIADFYNEKINGNNFICKPLKCDR